MVSFLNHQQFRAGFFFFTCHIDLPYFQCDFSNMPNNETEELGQEFFAYSLVLGGWMGQCKDRG